MSGPNSRKLSPTPVFDRRALLRALACAVAGSLHAGAAFAEIPTIGKRPGRPRIKLDRLVVPDVPGAAEYTRHLTTTLRQEGRRADWGAGRGSTIAFRFVVEELTLTHRGSALEVRCSARGELPRRRTARSKLVYSGDPKQPRELVKRVLAIVARGVVTRLAELERARRQR